MRDKECLAAGANERRGDLVDAAAIGIALDHGGAFARDDARAQRLVVGGNGAEVDGQRAAGLLRRGRRAVVEAGSGGGADCWACG